jgi:hypothetical protein
VPGLRQAGDPVISVAPGSSSGKRLLHHRLRQDGKAPEVRGQAGREKPAEKKSETAAEGDQEGRATARKPSPSERRDPAELARVAASLGPTASTSCSSGPATRATATWPPTSPWSWPAASGPTRAGGGAGAGSLAPAARAGRPTEIAGPASSTSGSPETSSPARATHPDGGPAYGRSTAGAGLKVNVEFVSANPYRTAPRRSRPRRRPGRCRSRRCSSGPGTRSPASSTSTMRQPRSTTGPESVGSRPRGVGPPVRDSRGGYHGEYLRENARAGAGQEGPAWPAERADGIAPVPALGTGCSGRSRIATSPSSACISTCELGAGHLRRRQGRSALALLAERGLSYEAEARSWLRTTHSATTRTGSCEGDGSLTYLVPDIAYHMDKHDRGFDRAIDVWGADHHGYIPRMRPCSCPGLSARLSSRWSWCSWSR